MRSEFSISGLKVDSAPSGPPSDVPRDGKPCDALSAGRIQLVSRPPGDGSEGSAKIAPSTPWPSRDMTTRGDALTHEWRSLEREHVSPGCRRETPKPGPYRSCPRLPAAPAKRMAFVGRRDDVVLAGKHFGPRLLDLAALGPISWTPRPRLCLLDRYRNLRRGPHGGWSDCPSSPSSAPHRFLRGRAFLSSTGGGGGESMDPVQQHLVVS